MAVQIPSSRQAVVELAPNKMLAFTVPWYRFFGLLLGLAAPSGADPAVIAVGVSPFSYDVANFGTVFVAGGTVSAIELGRNGVFTNTGTIAGPIPVSEGDVVRVTYTVLPTMTLVRR